MSEPPASAATRLQRLPTGVPGLDTVLNGGFLKGGTYIFVGMPGAGKTILGNQIAFNHVAAGGRVVYVTLLAETHGRMLAHLSGLRFFDADPLATRLHYVSAYRVLTEGGLPAMLELMRRLIREHQATMLVLDGLVSAQASAPNEVAFKEFIHELNTLVSVIGCTTFLLTNGRSLQDVHPEHTMVDGLVELTDELVGVRAVRELIVRKFRGSAHLRGRHVFRIDGSGIVVYPRCEASLEDAYPVPAASEGRAAFGLAPLDAMLAGGLQRGSATLLMGPSGAGKSLLALQFLDAGLAAGERALCFGFYESPPRMLAKGAGIGLAHLEPALADGRLQMLWQPPVELVVDALADRVLRVVREGRVQRLMLDGVAGFKESTAHPERINRFFAGFLNQLRASGVTSVLTDETRVLFGPEIEPPVKALSALVENHIFLRQLEVGSELRRALAIFKTREAEHDPSVREFHVTSQGFVLSERFAGMDQLLTGQGRVQPRAKVAGRGKNLTRRTAAADAAVARNGGGGAGAAAGGKAGGAAGRGKARGGGGKAGGAGGKRGGGTRARGRTRT